jgi:hypothetical protein
LQLHEPDFGGRWLLIQGRVGLGLVRRRGLRSSTRHEGYVALQTIFDLVTMLLFAGLVVLFLQRSSAPEPRDHMYQYAPPAIGCAVSNYFGNQGEKLGNLGLVVVAWVLVAGVIGYVVYVLKPFSQTPQG